MIKGNKGEWSELYVLLHLLAEGKLHAADEELRLLECVYSPILRIFRNNSAQYDFLVRYPVFSRHFLYPVL